MPDHKCGISSAGQLFRLSDSLFSREQDLTGTWMTETSFAAIPYLCLDEILDMHVIWKSVLRISAWHQVRSYRN